MNTTNEFGQLVLEKKVELKPYTPRKPKQYQLMTDEEILNNAGGTLVLDCEFYPNYVLIAFMEVISKKIIKFEINNNENIYFNEKKLSWVLHNFTTVGFNSIKYDIPLIWLAYKEQNTKLLKEASNDLTIRDIWYKELQKAYGYSIYPTKHIDLIEVAPLKGSLKLYAARLHAERIQDLPIYHEKILTQDEIEIISDYCINSDLPATNLLFDNLKEQLKLREDLSLEYGQDLMSKSDAQIAEAVIGSELKRLTGKYPSKPKIKEDETHFYKPPQFLFFQTENMQKILHTITNAQYKLLENGRLVVPKEIENLKIQIGKSVYRIGIGGLHSSEKESSIKSNDDYELIDKDVASYYPAIVLNLGLYPKHIGENFLTVYKTIVDRRLKDKSLGSKLKKEIEQLEKQIAILKNE